MSIIVPNGNDNSTVGEGKGHTGNNMFYQDSHPRAQAGLFIRIGVQIGPHRDFSSVGCVASSSALCFLVNIKTSSRQKLQVMTDLFLGITWVESCESRIGLL